MDPAMIGTSAYVTCPALIGPIWKLDGETCGCSKAAGHDLRDGHDCPCGSWWADPSTATANGDSGTTR